jgi:hypothetical protein
MKKKTQPATPAHNDKGFLALAGEALHVLGEEIVEGKDKVMEVAADKFAAVKKAIKNIAHKKVATSTRTTKKAVKKAVKKAAPKKAAKKVVHKVSAATRRS